MLTNKVHPHCQKKLNPLWISRNLRQLKARRSIQEWFNFNHLLPGQQQSCDLFLVEWSENMVSAFQGAKHALAAATLLVQSHATTPPSITVDASNIAVGGVLMQLLDGKRIPLAFFSRQLCPHETRYSTFDQELLALTSPFDIFAIFWKAGILWHIQTINGIHLHLLRSQTPGLQVNVTQPTFPNLQLMWDMWRAKTTTWQMLLLVQLSVPSVPLRLGLTSQHWQQRNKVMVRWMLIKQLLLNSSRKMLRMGTPRIFSCVTPPRANLIQLYQYPGDTKFFKSSVISHPSICATGKLGAVMFVWHGMSKQVGEWAKACVSHQLSKVQRHVTVPLESFKVPHRRFDYIQVDLIGLLPPFTRSLWTVSLGGLKPFLWPT